MHVLLHPDDLLCDLETRSRVNLKTAGHRRYAADPSTRITVAVWWFRGVLKVACPLFPWLGTHALADLYEDIRNCRRFVAHNASFDVNVLRGQNPFMELPLSKIDCTMGRAQALALPGGLDEVCKVLGLPGKDPEGHALVMLTCKPETKGPNKGNFHENAETFRKLVAYAIQDVRCLINLDAQLPPLPTSERVIWERTWRKNEKGLPVDVALATAIAMRREEIEAETTATLTELTGGAVTKVSQRERIITWANGGNRAAGLLNTQKHTIAEKLADESLHPDVRLVLEIVQESGGSAPTKAQTLLDRHVAGVYKDGTRYFGTRSGRGTSEGFNAFNIARPSGKYKPAQVIAELVAGRPCSVTGRAHNNVALTDALRGLVAAPDGYMVIDNDLSNAEYRIAMWLAGDQGRLNLLAAGGDPYMHNAIQMGWCPPGSTKETHPKLRQDAKPVTLGGNYQLGWRTYQAHEKRAGRILTDEKAQGDIQGYRNANQPLQNLWDDLKEAFKQCIYDNPGRWFTAAGGKVAFQKDGLGTIWLRLPSGRMLPHYDAHTDHFGNMMFYRGKYGMMWRQKVFGGSLLEIYCQSITRDLVTAAEEDCERELPDVDIRLDVYDSLLSLVPAHLAEERAEQQRAIMRRVRPWAIGLPVDAEGYVADRMRK